MASNIKSLRSMGYSVGEAFNQDNKDEPTVYVVSGYGLTTYIREDDKEALDSLTNPTVHKARQKQFKSDESVSNES